MSDREATKMARVLGEVLSEARLNALGKRTGQSKRLRVVTPFRLVVALIVAMAEGMVESIADLGREFNFQTGTTTAYKAFYNRLARPSFPKFMRSVALSLMSRLALRVLRPDPSSPLARFRDIVIQDGTSFAVKPALKRIFPGRFMAFGPAAVEVHVTFSGFQDGVARAHVSPDSTAERHFLPKPEELAGKLILADRGYPSRSYFQAVDAAGGHFLVRLPRGFKPWVVASHGARGGLVQRPIRLPEFLAQHPGCALDLDIDLVKGKKRFCCRLVVRPGKEKYRTRLCTNLPRAQFEPDLISRLYRFRWQVELLFKEWKSYANLRGFDTANKHIVRGLIWATLAAAVIKRFMAHAVESATDAPISTRKVAMCARLFLRTLLTSLGHSQRFRTHMKAAIAFLTGNARRADTRRDKQRGRLWAGLQACSRLAEAA